MVQWAKALYFHGSIQDSRVRLPPLPDRAGLELHAPSLGPALPRSKLWSEPTLSRALTTGDPGVTAMHSRKNPRVMFLVAASSTRGGSIVRARDRHTKSVPYPLWLGYILLVQWAKALYIHGSIRVQGFESRSLPDCTGQELHAPSLGPALPRSKLRY